MHGKHSGFVHIPKSRNEEYIISRREVSSYGLTIQLLHLASSIVNANDDVGLYTMLLCLFEYFGSDRGNDILPQALINDIHSLIDIVLQGRVEEVFWKIDGSVIKGWILIRLGLREHNLVHVSP